MRTVAHLLFGLTASVALIAGCATSDEDTDDGAGAFSQGTPSYVGTRVVSALRGSEAAYEGKTWQLTNDNQLDADWLLATPHIANTGHFAIPSTCTTGASCDPDFLLTKCSTNADCGSSGSCQPVRATVRAPGQTPRNLCVGDADTLVDEVYDVVTSAESFIDIASLSTPQGRFTAALRNGLTFLATKKKPIDVRMIFGNYVTEPTDPDKVLAAITRDLPAGNALKVNIGAFRSAYDSWNHAKIVAADGRRAIVGGHNMWQEDYLSVDPVTDVSMRLSGSAAGTAHAFVDQLWSYDCTTDWYLTTSHEVSSSVGARCAPMLKGRTAGARIAGGSVVVGVGRLGEAGTSNASDTALVALLGAAKKTIRLSLQDLGPPTFIGVGVASWPTATIQELAKALARGVDVYVTLSDLGAKGTGGGNYSNGWQPIDVVKKIEEAARTVPSLALVDVIELLCQHLHVAPLRYGTADTWADGKPFANHSKLAIVDEQAFYIGSQNLYIADLAEFGYIVDDAPATKTLLASLWTPEWTASSRAAVTGTETTQCQLR